MALWFFSDFFLKVLLGLKFLGLGFLGLKVFRV